MASSYNTQIKSVWLQSQRTVHIKNQEEDFWTIQSRGIYYTKKMFQSRFRNDLFFTHVYFAELFLALLHFQIRCCCQRTCTLFSDKKKVKSWNVCWMETHSWCNTVSLISSTKLPEKTCSKVWRWGWQAVARATVATFIGGKPTFFTLKLRWHMPFLIGNALLCSVMLEQSRGSDVVLDTRNVMLVSQITCTLLKQNGFRLTNTA